MSVHRSPTPPAHTLVVRADDIRPEPWKNGGGETRELLRWPAVAAATQDTPPVAWTLRLSLADITRDGPFSSFPGVVRWFCVLEGDGVELALPEGPRRLRPGDAPLCFDGAAAPDCRLLGGPTRDLNLMLRGADGALVPASAGDPQPPTPDHPATMVGYFEHDTRRLTWPCSAPRAPAAGWWILLQDATRAEVPRSSGDPVR